MKVLLATDKPFAAQAVRDIKSIIVGAGYEFVLLERYTNKQELLQVVNDVDALIIRSDIVDKEVIVAAPKLKLLFVPDPAMTISIWKQHHCEECA